MKHFIEPRRAALTLVKLSIAGIFLLSLGILTSSCGKNQPIVLPGNRILEYMEVDSKGLKVWGVDQHGEKILVDSKIIHQKYAISQAYLFEVMEKLQACEGASPQSVGGKSDKGK